jgi:hypothetical protein
MFDAFDIPSSLIRKVVMVMESEDLDEVSAPGQEAWIKANKARFEKEYGVEKGKKILYAKAWEMHKEETELDQKKVAVSPRHQNDSSVLLEKGKKKEDDVDEEKEKITFDPMVEPNALSSNNDNNKQMKTV